MTASPPGTGTLRNRSDAYWPRFALIYGCGVLAATSLGKMTAIAPALSSELGLSLEQMALVTSSPMAVAAVAGLPVSHLLTRLPPRWALLGGCVIMAGAGLFGAAATGIVPLLAARLVESIGYLVVVTAAPVLIASTGEVRLRTSALAVWGTFLPVGLAAGAFGGGLLSGAGWRSWLVLEAAVAALVGAAASAALRSHRAATGPAASAAPGGDITNRLRGPLLLALGLASVSATIVATVSLLPTYLHQELAVSVPVAGSVTGAVSLTGVAGGVLCGWLLSRGVAARYAFAASALMPAGIAVAFLGSGGVTLAASGALLAALANEVVIAAIFASVPAVVATPSDIGLANGLLTQVGSAGSLAGPPLVGLVVLTEGGWQALAPSVAVLCLLGFLALRASVRPAN